MTMDYSDLVERTGAGSTLTGELLAPETVRKVACDAAIIPVVLGTRSEILDLGRTTRLVTPNSCRRCGSATGGAPSRAARGPRPGVTWSCPDPVDGYVLMLAYWIGVR